MDHVKTTRSLYLTSIKPKTKYSTRSRVDILLDYVDAKSVLDLGCVEHEIEEEKKTEWWLHGLIKKKASKLQGVDYDKEAIKELNEKGYSVCFANVEDMDLGETYDVVMAGELFEHLTSHRLFLESVAKHLNGNGRLVMSVPNANSLNYFAQTIVFGHETDAWDHSAFFTPMTMHNMLTKCGFEVEEIILYQPKATFQHENKMNNLLGKISNRVQQAVCWLFPSLARGLIVVAKTQKAENGN